MVCIWMTNFQEWRIFRNDEFLGMTYFRKGWIFKNDEFSRMKNFREWRIFWNDKFLGMTNFQEWWIFKNDKFSVKTYFGNDEFLGGIFLTFNLLPIASFRVGVPSILFRVASTQIFFCSLKKVGCCTNKSEQIQVTTLKKIWVDATLEILRWHPIKMGRVCAIFLPLIT